MKRYFFILLIFLTSCYESNVPISEAFLPIDESFLGIWSKDQNDGYYFQCLKLNETHYKIIEFQKKIDGKSNEKYYTAHVSMLQEEYFLNLQALGTEHFMIYKIILSADKQKIVLFPLTKNIKEKFYTSKKLKEFILQYKNLSFFYETEQEYFRK